ncbi:sulfatase [Gimesia aquarii]|uniref:Arylsulfatase n=1 Tax=Gimesia aquarii TaxID=2527964 RepID=A0A517VVE9_9PLAN|nr:sulfatase [Gimesia aquarii]QDT96977.1 Arylsulfatase [Gimesia aquarii]
MPNRYKLLLFVVCLFITPAVGLYAAESPQSTKPNIILILIDDMGWPDPTCYGHAFHETPNIDQLANDGVRFTDFYAACPVCSPTRASIQAGQYQARLHLTDFIPGHWRPFEKLIVPENALHLPLEIVTPAELLKTAGYKTAYFGKWHLGPESHYPDKQGYQSSLVTKGRHFAPRFRTTPKSDVPKKAYLADFLTEKTIEFMQQNKTHPFFVQLSHYAVHIPLEAKQKEIEKYQQKPKPSTGVNNPVYAAMVAHVDESVGRIVQALEELQLSENTVVIFSSDNGGLRQTFSGGETVSTNAPLRDEKGSLYEGGIRVPLIIKWPGVAKAGTTCAEPTISVDFWPTFAEIGKAKLKKHQIIDGLSLVPLLKDPSNRFDRDAIYFHYPHYHHSEPAGAIRTGNWKLIEFFADGRRELYNLEQDLSETTNLSAAMPQKAAELQQKLSDWRKTTAAALPQKNPKYDAQRSPEWWSRRNNQPIKNRNQEKTGKAKT